MNNVTLTRKELHHLVWSEPLKVLSKKYEISDNGLRKMCQRMMVPIPNSGHWARLPVNRMPPLKLSQRYSGKDTVTLLFRNTKKINEQAEQRLAVKEIEEDIRSNHVVRVFDTLIDPDELIVASKNVLNEKDGKCHKYVGVVTSEQVALDICVSPENVLRALCFMDALIKALMARGHDVRISSQETFAVVAGEEIKIFFREKLQRVEIGGGSYSYTRLGASGEVCFKARIKMNDRVWQDGKETLEEQLPAILARLEYEGKRLAEESDRNEAEHKKRRQKEKRERAVAEKKEKELKKFQGMLDQSERWKKANDLRAYIYAREQYAIANNLMTEEFVCWLVWAREKADWYDPFINKKDASIAYVDWEATETEENNDSEENSSFYEIKNWWQKNFYR
jgi:hypothetical protein